MFRNVLIAFFLSSGLLAGTPQSQDSQQPPDTTQRFDPETGVPVVIETKLDTSLRFDSETGQPLGDPSTNPQKFRTKGEPGAGESAKLRQSADKTFELSQFLAQQPFPIQFIGGPQILGRGAGGNLAVSYRFSEEIEIKGYRDKYKSFYVYPALTLGAVGGDNIAETSDDIESYSVFYGIIEGHRQWEMLNLRQYVFLGAGIGGYLDYARGDPNADNGDDDFRGDSGIGLVLSAGARLESPRLMGGLRLYRTPGLRNFVAVANVGYHPKSSKETLIIAGIGAGIAAVRVLVALVVIIFFPFLRSS